MEMMPNKSKKGEIAMNKEELRKEVLKLIYDKGYRYIVRDKDGAGNIFIEKPEKGARCWFNRTGAIRLFFFESLFEDVQFEDKKPLNIAEELGFIDWATIPEDTKVLVSYDNEHWEKRHFAYYDIESKINKFIVYGLGKSSWTLESGDYRPGYKYCKLAEEE